MAVLTATPLVYVHGVDSTVWKDVWGFARPGDLVWGGALGACVGAWLGAVPIPLDWYIFFFLSFTLLFLPDIYNYNFVPLYTNHGEY